MKVSSLLVKPVSSKISSSVKTAVVASLLGLSSVSGVASAASQCKGLDNNACNQNSACGWVESYQRKDGLEVNAFCRTSTKGKAKKVADSSVDKSADKKAVKKADTKADTKAS